MSTLLFDRSVSERMFCRQSRITEQLLSISTTDVRIIKRHLSELTNRWLSLQEKHDSYVIEQFTDPIEIAANEALIDKYLSKFLRIEAACIKFIPSHVTPLSVTDESVTAAIPTTNSIKLERVKFRTFDGDVRKYPKFKEEFEKFVQPLCSPHQLTFVLKSYLCDSVRREIESIDHYLSAMWKRLDEKYGTIQKHIDCIMNDFKLLPVCSDSKSVLNMINVIEAAEADLKCLNATKELENSTIISCIEECMTREMFSDWALLIAENDLDSDIKFKKLLKFLRQWKRAIEYNDADIRNSTMTRISTPMNTSTRKCLIHVNDGHPIWKCRAFDAMTATERYNLIKQKNACTLCLETGHNSTNCNKTFRCTASGCSSADHNVLLHGAFDNA